MSINKFGTKIVYFHLCRR